MIGAVLLPAAAGFEMGLRFGGGFVGALLLLAAWVANAQPQDGAGPPPPGPWHRRPPVPLIIKALDTNGDGIIDGNEIANATAALKTLDKNGDGRLTLEEYIGPWASRTNAPASNSPEKRPPLPPVVKVLDTNGDGIIDANEMANAPAALKTLDKNGDGKLTPDEYLPPRPPSPDGGFAAGPPPDGGPPGGPPPDGAWSQDGPPGGPPPDGAPPPDGPPPGDPPPDGPPPK